MKQQGLALNESIQLHEILTLKNLSLTKSNTMSPLISDEELKTIIKDGSTATERHIRELLGFLEEEGTADTVGRKVSL